MSDQTILALHKKVITHNSRVLVTHDEQNTWSFGIGDPIIYDYIFHRNMNKSRVHIWTNWFEMPFFKTAFNGKNISFSDHEAVTSSFTIKQLKPSEPSL